MHFFLVRWVNSGIKMSKRARTHFGMWLRSSWREQDNEFVIFQEDQTRKLSNHSIKNEILIQRQFFFFEILIKPLDRVKKTLMIPTVRHL